MWDRSSEQLCIHRKHLASGALGTMSCSLKHQDHIMRRTENSRVKDGMHFTICLENLSIPVKVSGSMTVNCRPYTCVNEWLFLLIADAEICTIKNRDNHKRQKNTEQWHYVPREDCSMGDNSSKSSLGALDRLVSERNILLSK